MFFTSLQLFIQANIFTFNKNQISAQGSTLAQWLRCLAPELEFAGSRLCWIPKQIYKLLYKCAVLWRAVYGPSATERPLETIREEKGISTKFWVSVLSRYEVVESDVKSHSCLPLDNCLPQTCWPQIFTFSSFTYPTTHV